MATCREKLNEHNKQNLIHVDRLIQTAYHGNSAKFKQHITEFLKQESKLLVFEPYNLSLGALRIRQVLKNIEGRYEDQLFVTWEQLISSMGPSKMFPKLPNLILLQFDKPIEENDGDVLKKLLKRLSMSAGKKIVVISSEKNCFDNFLQPLDFEISFIKMDDFNVTSKNLVEVAAMGRLNDVIDLISHGVDINQIDQKKNTALHQAAEGGHRELVLKLMAHGAKHLKNCTGNTPLHSAARKGHDNVLTILLENKHNQSKQTFPSDDDINEVNQDENTALHLAAQGGHRDAVLKLMEYGAKLLRNSAGNTPLHLAALEGHNNVLIILLENKQDQSRRTVLSDDDINKANRNKDTALHLAAQGGYVDAVLTLWCHGAWFLQNSALNTPLHLAANAGHNDVVTAFLEHDVDVDIKGNGGYMPLHYAAWKGHGDVLLTLIEYGAKIDSITIFKSNALHLACLSGHLKIVKTLLERDARTNSLLSIQDVFGRTPLERARLEGHKTIVDYLTNRKA